MRNILLVLFVFFSSSFANFDYKDEIHCTLSKSTKETLKRRIVVSTTQESKGACKVDYYKDTEEPWKVDVLWQSPYNAQYCRNNAKDLANKLRKSGWKCDGNLAQN